MLIRLRVSTNSLSDMRTFLATADVDMGCTPFTENIGDKYTMTVLADEQEYKRLVSQRPENVQMHALENITVPMAPLRMKASVNRFESGHIPHGFGTKE